MGIIDRLSASAAVTRLRAPVDRLRRSVMSQRPAVRWGLALAAILGLAAAGYWAATSLVPVGARYLASGRRFSSEDLNKICRVLDAQRIEYRCDDQHKIAVDADQFDQAAALVAKLDVGPRPIDEARDQVNSWSVWFEGPREREQKEKLAREKMVESMIRKLDGVVWSLVSINRPRASVWHRTAAKPTAFVYIETEGDRQLPFQVIQSIPELLVGCEPDLTIGSITVMDRRGHRYLDPGNPSLGDISRKRAREEELSEQILEQLHYIKGVRVQVRVITPAAEPARLASVPRPATPRPPTSRRSISNRGLQAGDRHQSRPWSSSPSRRHPPRSQRRGRRRRRRPARARQGPDQRAAQLLFQCDDRQERSPRAFRGRVAPDGPADREADPDTSWTWSFPSPDRGTCWSTRSPMTYHWPGRRS